MKGRNPDFEALTRERNHIHYRANGRKKRAETAKGKTPRRANDRRRME